MISSSLNQRLVFIITVSLCLYSALGDSQISMAKQFGCSMDEKIEIKDIISQCQCYDKSSCVWTVGRKPVMGCPCPVRPPADTNYDSIITADIVNCSEKKIEIDKKIGKCECANGGQCIFAGRKTLAGCPCEGGRLPVESDFVEVKSLPHRKKARKPRRKHEEL